MRQGGFRLLFSSALDTSSPSYAASSDFQGLAPPQIPPDALALAEAPCLGVSGLRHRGGAGPGCNGSRRDPLLPPPVGVFTGSLLEPVDFRCLGCPPVGVSFSGGSILEPPEESRPRSWPFVPLAFAVDQTATRFSRAHHAPNVLNASVPPARLRTLRRKPRVNSVSSAENALEGLGHLPTASCPWLQGCTAGQGDVTDGKSGGCGLYPSEGGAVRLGPGWGGHGRWLGEWGRQSLRLVRHGLQ